MNTNRGSYRYLEISSAMLKRYCYTTDICFVGLDLNVSFFNSRPNVLNNPSRVTFVVESLLSALENIKIVYALSFIGWGNLFFVSYFSFSLWYPPLDVFVLLERRGYFQSNFSSLTPETYWPRAIFQALLNSVLRRSASIVHSSVQNIK